MRMFHQVLGLAILGASLAACGPSVAPTPSTAGGTGALEGRLTGPATILGKTRTYDVLANAQAASTVAGLLQKGAVPDWTDVAGIQTFMQGLAGSSPTLAGALNTLRTGLAPQ